MGRLLLKCAQYWSLAEKCLFFFITCHHQTLGQGVKIPSKQCDHFSYGQNFLADYSHPLCRSVQHHQLLLSFRRNQIFFLPAAIAESHRGCVCAVTSLNKFFIKKRIICARRNQTLPHCGYFLLQWLSLFCNNRPHNHPRIPGRSARNWKSMVERFTVRTALLYIYIKSAKADLNFRSCTHLTPFCRSCLS